MEGSQSDIDRIKISDDDVRSWMETLREGGFTDAEIDRFFSGLNITYFEAKMTKDMKGEFERRLQKIESNRGRKLTPEEKRQLLESFQSYIPRTH